jgi:hypothetical protein
MALYKTDMSPQKTAARALAYSRVQRRQFLTGKHIVIASRKCGDIRHLIDHGIKPSNIIACDVDYVARAMASRLGATLSPKNTIEETVRWAFQTYGKANIASINVDLCAGVEKGTEILADVFSTCEANKYKGAIFFTFFRPNRKGGMKGKDNIDYITTSVGIGDEYFAKNGLVFPYQSYTPNSVGSPMCMIAF